MLHNSRFHLSSQARSGAALILAAVVCMGFRQQETMDLSLPVPPPLASPPPWRDNRNGLSELATAGAGACLVLAQVISVKVDPTGPRARPGSAPEVSSGRLHIIETLVGHPVSGDVQIVNPVADRRPYWNHGSPPTQVMRPGELWILRYDSSRAQQLNGYGSQWLTGPSDPIIHECRYYAACMRRTDSAAVMNEVAAQVRNALLSDERKHLALQILSDYGGTRAAVFNPSTPHIAECRRVVTALLAAPNLPNDIRVALYRMTSIDLSHEVAAGSYEAIQLQYLLHVVANSHDDGLVNAAAEALYYVEYNPIREQALGTLYYCPEIIETLEERKAVDEVNGTRGSFVTRTLGNLDLAQHRTIAQLKYIADTAASPRRHIVIRHPVPAGHSALSQRVMDAAARL